LNKATAALDSSLDGSGNFTTLNDGFSTNMVECVMILVRSLLTAAVLIGLPSTAFAQTYPNRPITLVVPFTAGAVTDIMGRFIGEKLAAAFGQPVVIENRPGAGGIVGASVVSKANPDGYTLLLASTSVVHGPMLQKAPSYDSTKDFTPVAGVLQTPFVLAVNLDVPAKDVVELVTYIKANPGKINSASIGGFADVLTLMFKQAANVDVQIVNYRGVPEAVVGVMRNDAQLTMNPYASIQSQADAKQIRMLAVTADQRSSVIPNVPTFAEMGLPQVNILNVVGILAPPNTPKDIVEILNREISKIVQSEEGRRFIISRGNDEIADPSTQNYAKMLRDVGEKYQRIINDFGLEKR
jgi:tripartite-type tricarboxylate transporter receptor subunit TctC